MVGRTCVRPPRPASAAGRRSMRGVRSAAMRASAPRPATGRMECRPAAGREESNGACRAPAGNAGLGRRGSSLRPNRAWARKAGPRPAADERNGRSTVGCEGVRRPRPASAAGRRSMRGAWSVVNLASGLMPGRAHGVPACGRQGGKQRRVSRAGWERRPWPPRMNATAVRRSGAKAFAVRVPRRPRAGAPWACRVRRQGADGPRRRPTPRVPSLPPAEPNLSRSRPPADRPRKQPTPNRAPG